MPEIVAQRSFNLVYVILDTVFLFVLCFALAYKKRYMTLLFGLFGGVLYFIVDYGIFHLATHTRSIEGGSMFWVLLWMSMSYGLTNFVWIWLCLRHDEHLVEFLGLILVWWFVCPILAETFGSSSPVIKIQRTTGAYHGYMALILLAGYFAAIVYNLMQSDRAKRFRILWLLLIGVSVQLGWEASLLIGGIRSTGIESFADKLHILVVNSLLETNLGLPPIYLLYLLYTTRFTETLRRRETPITLGQAIVENNSCSSFSRSSFSRKKKNQEKAELKIDEQTQFSKTGSNQEKAERGKSIQSEIIQSPSETPDKTEKE